MQNRLEIRLGQIVFDLDTRDLRDQAGNRIELRNKSSEVLAFLSAHPGQIVSKSDIMDAVWSEVTVSDESLTQCIADIRRALGDKNQRILKTHIGKGYSLNASYARSRRSGGALIVASVLGAIAIAAGVFWFLTGTGPAPNAIPRIAVLAFDDLSVGEEKGWLGDAIAEGVITELARYREFLVLSRNSSFSYRSTPTDIAEIAAKLNADFIVEGSKQKSGDRLRVTVQLINAHDSTHIWADEFDADIGELFDVQSEIVRSIAAQLGRELSWSPPQTGNRQKVDALHYFFLGNQAFEAGTPGAYRQAIDFYEQSIAADPDSPFGYVGMATVVWSDITQGWIYPDVPREELLKLGVDYAEMAITIDPTYYAAHIARGDMHFSAGEHEQAIVRYGTAAELNPSSSTAMAVASDPLIYTGRTEEAIALMERAIEVNPITPGWYYNNLSRAYWDAGRCAEGEQTIRKRASLREWDYRALIVNLVCQGKLEEAQYAAKQLLELNPDFTVSAHARRVRDVMNNTDYHER
ncbi:MAG: winged helix-turn-helix domain-containing protein, partial [Paracoccaceae bacterium]|nr:winged helix-turn-helix domain-containing protein [Paracoccaceae bacterium]